MRSLKNYLTILAFSILILSVFFSTNLKLDASSDTLIMQNDETYKYYEYYNEIFPNKYFLVLVIKSNKKIDDQFDFNL